MLFGGSETSLFTKRELYLDFNKNKKRILHRFPKGIKSHSFHMYNGVDLNSLEYGMSDEEIKNLIESSFDFQSFSDGFFEKGKNKYGKTFWIEKTPGNAYLFKEFLETFEDGKVIHISRNPIDTIFSLIKRGFNLLQACGIYLLNTSAALRSENSQSYLHVSYDQLIQNPDKSLSNIFSILDLDFPREVLQPGNPYGLEDTKISSWKYDETSTITPQNSIIPDEMREKILVAIHSILVAPKGKELFDLTYLSIPEISSRLGYQVETSPSNPRLISHLRTMKRMDRIDRLRRWYISGLKYPLYIKAQV